MSDGVSAGPLRWQKAVIADIVPRTPRVTSFFLKPSSPLAFRAGQHVDVRLTAPDGYQARRGYSIASAPENPEAIELAIEKLENGEVSPFFHEVATLGDEIELRGPLGGHFIWEVSDGGPILLIGGGSGVVPLVSMVRHRAAQGSTVPMLLLFSARTWSEIIFRDELLALHERRDGFELVLALTREPVPREGAYLRRLDAAMTGDLLQLLPGPPKRAYVCGSNPFVAAASAHLVAAGLPPQDVRTERYGVAGEPVDGIAG